MRNSMYLISAYFDESTNRILQKYIDRIAEATGNDFMTENHVPPHMTISSIEARNPEVLLPAFESLRGRIHPGSIQFVTTGQLLPYVIYTAPVLNSYLQELSETVYAAFADIKDTRISRFYRPYSWLPHVTLGKTLDKTQMQQAFALMQDAFAVMESRIERFGLSEVNPHRDIAEF